MARKIYKVFCVKLPFLIVFLKALNRFFVLHMFHVYTKNIMLSIKILLKFSNKNPICFLGLTTVKSVYVLKLEKLLKNCPV